MTSAATATCQRGGPIPGLLAGSVFGFLQILLLANPSVVTLDPEELYNAAHAEAILSAGPAVILPLQYRPFCGGCTVDALLGAGLFTILGTSLLVWKLVPVLMGAVGVGALTQAAWRHVSPAAGGAVAVVLLASPPAWSRLGIVAWGNHYECSAIVLVALALAAGPAHHGRDLCLGLCLGFLLWVGWSGAFAVLGLVVWIGLKRQWARLLRVIAGAAVGFSPAILRTALTGQWPTATIYHTGETLPSLARLPGNLVGLLMPNQVAGLLGVRDPIFGPFLGVMAAVSLLVAAVRIARRPGWPRLLLGLLATWVGIYLLVRFPVQRSNWPNVPTVGGVRYAAPAMPLAATIVALASAALWRARRRAGAALLISPWLIAGLGSRLLALTPPFPSGAAIDQWPGDMDFFKEQASWALPLDLHQRGAVRGDERLRGVHAYALGRAAITSVMAGKDTLPDPPPALAPGTDLLESPAAQELSAAWAQGVAAVIVDRLDPGSSGEARILVQAMASVEQFADLGWTPAMRQAALREVIWRRADGWAPQSLLARGEDAEIQAAQSQRLAGLTLSVEDRQAVWWAMGRRLARDRARLWMASTVKLPLPGQPQALHAFIEGVGRALGERWGPQAADWPPRGLGVSSPPLDDASLVAYRAGVEAGLHRRWHAKALARGTLRISPPGSKQ